MLYELRVYRCVPGRLPALHKQPRPLLHAGVEGHGRARAQAGVFAADPEWLARRAESERDGQIVANITSSFLAPTAYSKTK